MRARCRAPLVRGAVAQRLRGFGQRRNDPSGLALRVHLPLQGRHESWGTECRASDIGHSKALFVARCSRVGMFAMTAGDGERKDDRACAGGEILC